MIGRRRATVLLVALGAGVAGAQALGAPQALDRAAVAVRQPARSVLLGAAQCGGTVVAVGERGVVALSGDRGRTWRQAAQVPVSTTLTAVRCGEQEGGKSIWAVGHGAIVLSSVDGGLTWARRFDGKQAAQLLLVAARARQPADAKAIADAQRIQAEGPDKPLLDLVVGPGGRIQAVGAYNFFFESVDHGKTWQSVGDRLDNPRQLHLNAIASKGEVVVIVGEQGLILRSDDAGRRFVRKASPYQGSWFAVTLVDADTMLVAGLRGQAWLTRDAGSRWTPLTGLPPATVVAARMSAPTGVMLQNQTGQLFLADIDKAAVTMVDAARTAPGTGLLPLDDGRVLALTVHGMVPLPTGPSKKGAP